MNYSMFQTIFITALFLPTIARVLLAFVFPPQRYRGVRLALFLISIIAVGVPLCVTGFSASIYGRFIPLMIATFWLPQLAFIVFFAWCDRENAKATLDNPYKPANSGKGVSH